MEITSITDITGFLLYRANLKLALGCKKGVIPVMHKEIGYFRPLFVSKGSFNYYFGGFHDI